MLAPKLEASERTKGVSGFSCYSFNRVGAAARAVTREQPPVSPYALHHHPRSLRCALVLNGFPPRAPNHSRPGVGAEFQFVFGRRTPRLAVVIRTYRLRSVAIIGVM